MSEAATYSDSTKSLGDQIVALTLKQAKELADYLENEHGIKAAAGGAVMMAGPAAAGPAAPVEAQTEFDVVLEAFGENKIGVINCTASAIGTCRKQSSQYRCS